MKTIVIIQFSSQLDGSAVSGLMLSDGFRKAGWKTIVVFAHQGPLQKVFQEHGHIVLTVFHRSWLRSSSIFRFSKNLVAEVFRFRGFRKIFMQYSPDIVYINTAVSFSAALTAKWMKVPFIWHIRELFNDVGGEMEIPHYFKRSAQFVLTRWPKAVIVNSKAVAENMLLPSASGYKIVPNAIDDTYFDCSLSSVEARQRLGLDIDKYIIGIPGTLRPMKGHPYFLRAIASVLRDSPSIQIIISGDGDLEYIRTLKDLCAELKIEKQVEFLGRIIEMPVFYKACNISVIPSRAEPFGRVVIESFASQIPVVATSVGGIPEIIQDGINGYLVPYGDETAMSNIVRKLIKDPEYLGSIVSIAYKDARRNYTAIQYQKSILEFVNSVNA